MSTREVPPPVEELRAEGSTTMSEPLADDLRASAAELLAQGCLNCEPPKIEGGSEAPTWYCWPGVSRCTRGVSWTTLAAAVPPGFAKVGSMLQVCAKAVCVTVRVVDCLCSSASHAVIDLYGSAFKRLAPFRSGIVRVTIRRQP